MRIAIIGSGIGGLGVAIKLAKQGHTVTVYEKNEVLGGRAGVFKEAGFTFDMGPSWYLMPDVFEKFFASVGENIHDHLDLVQLDPAYRIFFEKIQGPTDIPFSAEKAATVVESFEPGAGETFKRYLKKTEKQYNLVVEHFLYKEYRTVFDLISFKGIQALWTLPLIGSIDRYIRKFFVSKQIRQLLEYTMVFLGASPYNAPALYAMMAHADFGLGVFYSKGGVFKLVEALEHIGKKYGVQYVLNSPVQHIEVVDKKAKALILEDGNRVEFDIVISNADMHHTETKLLDEAYRSYPAAYWDKAVLAPSAILMYLGIKGKIDAFKHHTLYFSDNWDEHFDAIFKKSEWPKNPSYYISTPSRTDSTVAPEGDENVFVLVPIASRFGTPEECTAYADVVLDHIAKTTGVTDLKERIIYKKIFGPQDFESRYNSIGGTALGLAHTINQTAVFRPQNKSKKVSNLYYVGAGVHPGIGVPVCLISADLVAKRISKEYTK